MLEQADITGETEITAEPPFLCVPGDPARGCVVICDHATNLMPQAYRNLDMPDDQMGRHIAYDIGAAGVTARLCEHLGAPGVLANFSRLLIDPNRGEDDPTLVMRLSDGAVVPGNASIDSAEIDRRRALYYDPYHAAVDAAIDAGLATGRPPVILSVHTFTESWRGRPRPWDAGILWDKDPRLARPLIDGLAGEAGLIIGDNEPYTGKLKNDCLYKHGTARGLAHALVEIRQDLVRHRQGQREWGDRLARTVAPLLEASEATDALHTVKYYGSWTDDPASGAGDAT